jgi:hypothetical protein
MKPESNMRLRKPGLNRNCVTSSFNIWYIPEFSEYTVKLFKNQDPNPKSQIANLVTLSEVEVPSLKIPMPAFPDI